MPDMTLTIPDEIIGTNLTEDDIRLELATALYAARKISFGKARKLAGVNWFEFRAILSEKGIPAHYDVAQFEEDLQMLESMPAL